MSKTVPKIKWGRSQEGYVDSHCGRFQISPLYYGSVKPQWFKVEWVSTTPRVLITMTAETQREAKAEAQKYLDKQDRPEDLMDSDMDWDDLL